MVKGLIASAWQGGYRTPEGVSRMITFCQEAGITDLYVQVRSGRGLYCLKAVSELEPMAQFGGTAIPDGFDPLQDILDKAGSLKIHAYVTTLDIGGIGCKRYPDSWLMRSLLRPDTAVFFDPTVPEVQAHIVNICKDIVTRYPAIHGLFVAKLFFPINTFGKGTNEDKCSCLYQIMKSIHDEVKAINPNIVISIDSNARKDSIEDWISDKKLDWRQCLLEGLIDKFCPTIFRTPDKEAKFDAMLVKLSAYDNVIPIIGACDLPLSKTMERLAKMSNGWIVFSYGAFSDHQNENSPQGEKRQDFKNVLWQS